jgi:SPP1 gp7 family putative phage head morphogenesis protein
MPLRDTRAQRRSWQRARRAELQFGRALRRVAAKCGALARRSFDPEAPLGSTAKIRRELENYGEALGPWARATAAKMVADVARRDESYWQERSKEMSLNLRKQLRSTPVGIALRESTYEAASYISSLPLEAAQRVQQLSIDYMTRGIRANVLAARVMATGQVTKGRANLIARTEVARTANTLVEVRSTAVGSEGYIWRTSRDADVRDDHRKLEGKFIKWSSPPIAGPKGMRYHAGRGPNCRCFPEPVLPGETPRQLRRANRFRAEPVVLQ